MTNAHPALRAWSHVWRYLLAVTIGAVAWIATAAALQARPQTPAQHDRIGTALLLDLILAVIVLMSLPLRRRYPLAVACLAVAVAAFSVATIGAATLAVISMATWQRRPWIVATAAAWLGAATVSETLYRPWFAPGGHGMAAIAANTIPTLLIFSSAVVTGFYIGTRRQLFASLHERALTAEREQTLAAHAAREAERTRIAREMHDDLAHRISLVALHAGALAYRQDLTREETTATAHIIGTNARLALTELRQVLGVLRGNEPSEPTLAQLPALLADAREAGTTVQLESSNLAGMPESLSRTGFRIVQEALTNARKHAPGQPVSIRLAATPGAQLHIDIRNPIGTPDATPLPSAGVGLTGLRERADLIGGTVEYGTEPTGEFVVKARLPWPPSE